MIDVSFNKARNLTKIINMEIISFIDHQLPMKLQARIPKLFMEAHALANQLISDTPLLQIPSFQPGDIRAAAVDFIVSNHIEAIGYAGITCEFKAFWRPTGKYLQIQTPDANVSISHINFAQNVPRFAEFRKQAKSLNHPFLFDDMEQERAESIERRHLIIAYGDQNLEFLHIGAMHPHAASWIGSPVDLLNRPFLIVDNVDDDLEGKDVSISMELKKEHFIEHISRNVAS